MTLINMNFELIVGLELVSTRSYTMQSKRHLRVYLPLSSSPGMTIRYRWAHRLDFRSYDDSLRRLSLPHYVSISCFDRHRTPLLVACIHVSVDLGMSVIHCHSHALPPLLSYIPRMHGKGGATWLAAYPPSPIPVLSMCTKLDSTQINGIFTLEVQ